MELIVLGCNGPYPDAYGATSGYLVRTDEGFTALDMGSGVFSRIGKLCPPEKLSAVVISHLHYDHMSDLGVFNYYLEALTKAHRIRGKLTCYVPPITRDIEDLEKRYPYFRFVGSAAGGKYEFGGLKADFCRLRHSVPSYGVRLTESDSGRSLVYSADTNVCTNLEKLLKRCDLWLGSAPLIGHEYTEGGYQLSVGVMEELAEKYGTHAVASHLSPMHTESEYKKAVFGKRVEIAKAFKSYSV